MATVAEQLTQAERERRDALYAGIDRTRPAAEDLEHLASFLEEIRDSRLYREEFETFENCCRHRWGWSRQRVNHWRGTSCSPTRSMR